MSTSKYRKDTMGRVYLVGAGPGDPGLITVKGRSCIEKSDVIVYDRLGARRLLRYAKPDTELIYVGKTPDQHTLKQEEINLLLVEKALNGHTVTRLKGGDPFVFGRGGEEALELQERGIPFEVVPGITSAISVPAYAGIPVTHRDVTSTFAVITGHEKPGKKESSIAWDKIATGAGTKIFLMGVGNLPFIRKNLIENGLSIQTPVALIRWGTLPEQETLVGTLGDIVEKVQAENFKPPAIIVVGDVVALRSQLAWFEEKPLFGQRVVVTRAREQASVLAEQIEELGGEAWEFPVISIAPPEDFGPLDRAISQIEAFDWLIFTSVNGVKYFNERLRACGRDIRDLKGIKLCAIGPRTRKALEDKGLFVDYVPSEYRAEAIVEVLQDRVKAGERVLLPRADIARKVLPAALSDMGAIVDDVVAYRTRKGSQDASLLHQMLVERKIQVVTFTSSSTVRNFVELLGPGAPSLLKGVILASIGPITSATAVELGLKIDVEAAVFTIDGLITALVKHLDS